MTKRELLDEVEKVEHYVRFFFAEGNKYEIRFAPLLDRIERILSALIEKLPEENKIRPNNPAALIAAAPELLEIAKAYHNLLKTMAHSDGEVATYHHIGGVINKAEGKDL